MRTRWFLLGTAVGAVSGFMGILLMLTYEESEPEPLDLED